MNLLSLLSLSVIPVLTATQSTLLWANDIQSDGKFLGQLEIYDGQEPVDATDSFVTTHIGTGGGSDFVGIRNSILDIVCEAIICNRRVPVVYRKSIIDDQENILGFIEIYEGEEAVDAVSRFFKTTERKFDDETMDAVKDYVISEACSNDRVLCSRDAAIAFDQMVNSGIDDSPIGRLVILENEDPADKVYKWCEEKNILQYYDAIVDAVCSSNKGMCQQTLTAGKLHSLTISSSMNDVEEKHEHADLQDMKNRNDNARVDDYFATCAC